MHTDEYFMADIKRIYSALQGREYGMLNLIDELMDLVQECIDIPRKLNGFQQIKVLDEEISMLMDFRKDKLKRAKKELEEIRTLKQSLAASQANQNYTGFNNE